MLAQYYLGSCYNEGKGVEKDYTEAVRWFRKAAEKGNDLAQCQLGIRYYDGGGVKTDYDEAVKWFKKAIEQFFKFY